MPNDRDPLKAARAALRQLPVRELLTNLEVLFPNRLPDSLMDPREVDARVGEQRVLSLLRCVAEAVERDVLHP
jgi:hypothetical protein